MKTQDLEKTRTTIKTAMVTVWAFLSYVIPGSDNRMFRNLKFYALMYGHAYRWIGFGVFVLLAILGPKKEVNPEAFDFMIHIWLFFCLYITVLHFAVRKTLPFGKPTINGTAFRIDIK